ncbi:hypothetical protein HKM21_27760 [Longimicrobium terrae]|uniref:Uncharacterized protein n=1 Tax=Longimicrobium terrae TaxID=1639882 RepID=A0A841GXE7_9BACT|nr:hypothetical protein [Longimicrobium terrae]MBB6070156.1 hypothetical protein [Longimicrobium terrae]NNC33057.1 hypothetical protein [Longimicrobium terrae]
MNSPLDQHEVRLRGLHRRPRCRSHAAANSSKAVEASARRKASGNAEAGRTHGDFGGSPRRRTSCLSSGDFNRSWMRISPPAQW